MLHSLCTVTGAVVLGSVAVGGTLSILIAAWWKFIEYVIAPRIGTNKLFFETAARILNERKAPDENQLSRWRWRR